MKLVSRIALLLFLAPLTALAQPGVRMSADFLPLEVGNRWVYDVFNEAGQKTGAMEFAVQEPPDDDDRPMRVGGGIS